MEVDLCARVSMDHQDADKNMKQLRQWAIGNKHKIVRESWIKESATIPIGERKEFKALVCAQYILHD